MTDLKDSFLREQYNFVPKRMRKIGQGVMNSNFYFESENRPYLFKIYNFRTPEEVGFEINILEHLKRGDFPSPRIVQNKAGELQSKFFEKPAVVYAYIEGAPLERVTPDAMRQVGALKGRMHVMLKELDPSVEKPRWDYEEIKILVEQEGHRLVEAGFPNAQELITFLKRELDTISISEDFLPRGITHQDVKPENIILKNGNVVGLVDFDNAYRGVLLYDIATTIIWSCFKNGVLDRELQDALWGGYEEERPLTEAEKENMHDAIRFRLLREAFITPYVTLHRMKEAKSRSDYFLKTYKNFA